MFGHRLEREILDALADGTPSYVVDLAATIDEHPVAVEHACDRLHEDRGGSVDRLPAVRDHCVGSSPTRRCELAPRRIGDSDGDGRSNVKSVATAIVFVLDIAYPS